MLQNFKAKVKRLKQESLVLYYAYSDQRLPFWKKMFVGLVVGYLFSPLDLIPDFIPVIGYLDDLIIVPLGLYISLRIIPPEILEDSRTKAKQLEYQQIPIGRKTAVIIVLVWVFGLLSLLYVFLRFFHIHFQV